MKRLMLGLAVTAVAALVIAGGLLAGLKWLRGDGPTASPVRERCVAETDAGWAALDTEQAANAALIAAVGQARGMSPRAVTIALATAMQESKLRNLDYGDRDSLGLFQQRPSQDWGTPEQIMDPLYAASEFYRELALVDGFESMPITEAAQAVQRSAYPEAYAQHEVTARSFASSLTGNSPGALTCELAPAETRGTPAAALSVFRAEWGDGAADRAAMNAPSEAEPSEGGRLALEADDAVRAWAYAEWAVAKAKELGLASVWVADQVWTRSDGVWVAAATGAAADAAAGTTPAPVAPNPTLVTLILS
jgi:hypothetical protein